MCPEGGMGIGIPYPHLALDRNIFVKFRQKRCTSWCLLSLTEPLQREYHSLKPVSVFQCDFHCSSVFFLSETSVMYHLQSKNTFFFLVCDKLSSSQFAQSETPGVK